MWSSGQALAAAATRAATCALTGLFAVSGPEARAAVEVRAVEVGNHGEVAPGFPAAVRAELSTDIRLDGTFRAWLDVSPYRQERDRASSFGRHTTSVRFRLEPGETRQMAAYLADIRDDVCSGFDVRWSVADADGRPLAEGAQTGRCVRQRALFLTDAAVPFARRPPAAAFDGVQSYSEYDVCLISGRDFAGLHAEQREALLDRTALGSTLVLAAPLASAGADLDRRLAAVEALVWRDAAGREIREVPLHLGFVRTSDRALSELAPGAGTPLSRLLLSDGSSLPHVDETRLRRQTFKDPFRGTYWDLWSPPGDTARVGRLATAGGFAFLGLMLVGLWWASRPRVATSARAVWAGAAALALSPTIAYLAAAPTRTGNRDECWDLVIHEGPGGVQSRWSRASLGGGGGREDPVLLSPTGPRSTWSATRVSLLEPSLQVEQDADGLLRVGPGRRGVSIDRLVLLRRAGLNPDEPAWDADEIVVREDRLAGALRARRPLARLAIVGPPGVAWFGSVRSGERIALSGARWSEPAGMPGLAGEPVERAASALWSVPNGTRTPASYYAVGAEPTPCSIVAAAGGDPPAPCTVHVQRLATEAASGLVSTLPAEREGDRVRVNVPEVLRERMRSRGLSCVPDVPFLESSREPDVSRDVVDGFRELVFRVGGAPTTGVWSLAGPGLTMCRWREAARRRP